MSKVFVVQESLGRNILSAKDYGEIVILLPPGQITFSPAPTIARLNKKLRDFDDDSALLLMGDPIAIGMATAIAAQVNGGRVKFLKWDKQENKYFLVNSEIFRQVSYQR